MSWNLRGSNIEEKLHSVRRLVRKFKPLFIGIQETRNMVNIMTPRRFWGNQAHKWVYLPSVGMSSSLLLMWNTDLIQVYGILKGAYSISLLVLLVGSETKWAISNVYGPCDPRLKVNFWRELSEVGSKWNVWWITFGDYNAIRCPSERSSGLCSKKIA